MSVVPVTRGHHYVVSAGHELAALAAFEALDNGGNAIDRGGRRDPDPRGGVQRSGEHRRGGAHDHSSRGDRGGGDHRRSRGLAPRPRPRCVHRAPPGRHPARRAPHRGAGGPRRVSPGAGALGHDDLPRRGRTGGALRVRRLCAPPGHARLRAPVRRRHAALAAERRNLDAERRGARTRRQARPGQSRPCPAISLRRGTRGRRRPHGRARGGAPGVLPGRHREPDPCTPAGTRRTARGRGSGVVPLSGRALGGAPLPLQRRGGGGPYLRRLVPGSVPARSALHRRGGRRSGPRVRLRRLPPCDCGDPQAHVRRSGRLPRRSGLRGRTGRYPHQRVLRIRAPRAIDPWNASTGCRVPAPFPDMPRTNPRSPKPWSR